MSRNKMFKESARGNLLRDVRSRAAMAENIMLAIRLRVSWL